MAVGLGRSRFSLVAAAVLLAGCAAAAPRVPKEFTLRRAHVEAVAEPPVALVGVHGKARGAAAGAVAGGVGVGITAAVPCLFLGVFAGPCLAAVVPTAAAIGAATGGVMVAAESDGGDVAAAKGAVLESALAKLPVRDRLVAHLQQQARGASTIDLRASAAGTQGAEAPWRIAIGTIFVAAEKGSEGPYGLLGKVSLALTRTRDARPAFQKDYEARSATRRPIGEWRADEAAPTVAALDDLMGTLASAMLADLLGVEAAPAAGPASEPASGRD